MSEEYLSKKESILRNFDSIARRVHPTMADSFPGEDIRLLIHETRSNLTTLIPQLPYIGGKEPFTQFIIYTGMWLAIYQTASAHGKTLEESGVLLFNIGKAYLKAFPRFLTRIFGYMSFTPSAYKKLSQQATASHTREYPEDYVFDFIEGDGKTFDYGVDYLECASCKFLARQGASELLPYLCPVDHLYSEALGWGLKRTTTLADGGEKCDFRFKRGGPTCVALPPIIAQYLKEKEKQ